MDALATLYKFNAHYIDMYNEQIEKAIRNIDYINIKTNYVKTIYFDVYSIFHKYGFVIYHVDLETSLGGIGFRFSYIDIDIRKLDDLLVALRDKYGNGVEIIDYYINIPFV